jgi:hypothetical protein
VTIEKDVLQKHLDLLESYIAKNNDQIPNFQLKVFLWGRLEDGVNTVKNFVCLFGSYKSILAFGPSLYLTQRSMLTYLSSAISLAVTEFVEEHSIIEGLNNEIQLLKIGSAKYSTAAIQTRRFRKGLCCLNL